MQQPNDQPLSILCIHDMALARDSLRYAFTYGAAEIVFSAYPSTTIAEMPPELEPTLILLSSAVQFADECHPVRVVQHYWPDAAIVLLEPIEAADQLWNVIVAGARGWVSAEASFPDLLVVMQLVAHGNTVFGAEVSALFRHWADHGGFDDAADCAHLSKREAEIVQCVRDGCTNPEIADQLGIVNKTVEAHLNRIFRKRGLTSRNDLHN